MKACRTTILVLLVIALTSTGTYANKNSLSLHHLTRFETHTQTGNSDFMYNGFFIIKSLQPGYTAFLSYLNKYSLDDDQTDSNIVNVSISNQRSKRLSLLYSYTNSTSPGNARTHPTGNDSDRWLFLAQYALRQSERTKLSLYSSFSTATDFSDSRTLNEKLKYDLRFTHNWKVSVSAQYSYNLNLDDNIFNLYSAELSKRFSRTTKFALSYILVDMQTGVIDDDDIFQGGVFRSY